MAIMSLDRIDAALTHLSGAAASQATVLMGLESAPERALIDPDRLTGATRDRATATLTALTDAWHCYGILADLVERARTTRGSRTRVDARAMGELDALLHSPLAVPPVRSAGTDGARNGNPHGSKPDSSPGSPAAGIRPTDLVDRADAALRSVRVGIDEIVAAWNTHLATVSAAEQEIAAVDTIASRLRMGDDAGLTVARRLLAELSEVAAGDPLSVPESLPVRLDAAIATARAGVAELARRHDTLPEALRDAATLLERIVTLTDQAAADADRARSRVLRPATPLLRLPDGVLDDDRHGLRTWLGRLTATAAAGRWKEASRGLDRWQELAEATLISARRIADTNAAPLRTRDDLRGLLGGWQAKAARQGVIEAPDLADLYRRAHSVLYTAPTDLDQAAELVQAFGAALDRRFSAGDDGVGSEPVGRGSTGKSVADGDGPLGGIRPSRGRETNQR
ncbi:hypothetical protein [Frankia sp. Cppng1_Ct_nod]|uniref:hypothetical protein n=1 Tax=Frankia sp. Cppng1_Ct_nod TaxID=2897162 RepID=UPI0010417467|nr:hypothetical protein [Frankia sp. Cppng1_Ct_nod]